MSGAHKGLQRAINLTGSHLTQWIFSNNIFWNKKNNAQKAKPHFILGTIFSIPFPALLVESHIKLSHYLPSAIKEAAPGLPRSSRFASPWGNSPLDSKVSLLLKDFLKVSKRKLCTSHGSFAYLVLFRHAGIYFFILYGYWFTSFMAICEGRKVFLHFRDAWLHCPDSL